MDKIDRLHLVEKVFAKYQEFLNKDLELYKKCLLETIEDFPFKHAYDEAYFRNLALKGFVSQMNSSMDEFNQDILSNEAHNILKEV